MPNYDETWVIFPTCDGPCPMEHDRSIDGLHFWKCHKCGAYKADVKPPEDEDPATEAAPDIDIEIGRGHGYGCVAIIGMLFVFLGWLAYLQHLVSIARYAQ